MAAEPQPEQHNRGTSVPEPEHCGRGATDATSVPPQNAQPSQPSPPVVEESSAVLVQTVAPAACQPQKHRNIGFSEAQRHVSNMKEGFDFFRHAVEEVLIQSDEDFSPDSNCSRQDFLSEGKLCQWMEDLSISTAYSGVGAPETTVNILRSTMASMFGHEKTIAKPKVLFQIEWDEPCRAELALFDNVNDHQACIFGDLCDFFSPHLAETISELKKRPELALEVLAGQIANGEAVVTSAYCYKHKKTCSLTL